MSGRHRKARDDRLGAVLRLARDPTRGASGFSSEPSELIAGGDLDPAASMAIDRGEDDEG